MSRRTWPILRFVISAVLVLMCPLAILVFSQVGEAFFPYYRQASKALIGFLSKVSGIVPIGIWDIGAALLVMYFVAALIRRIRRRRGVLSIVSWATLVVSSLVWVSVCCWALNHYAPALSEYLNLEVADYSTNQLAHATSYYLAEAAGLANKVDRTEDGSLASQDFFDLAAVAGASYSSLGEEFEVLSGSTTPVKALLVYGPVLVFSGHTGIFFPPTGESGVAMDCATAEMAFTMCHEAAHRLGIASEQEANFCAYLACSSSDDVRLAYSGAYCAFVYCYDALVKAKKDLAIEVVSKAAEVDPDGVSLVLMDLANTNDHYDAFEGPLDDVGTAANDAYLKTFGETEGVGSYGLVVDYLIAWCLS